MAKIKLKYKQIAKLVNQFMFKDMTYDIEGQAFQRFIEIMALPPGTKEYSDELMEIYILSALEKIDIIKQKEGKLIKKTMTELDKRMKKFIAQKQREKIWNKIKKFFKRRIKK